MASDTAADDAVAFTALTRHDRSNGKHQSLPAGDGRTVAEPVFVPRSADGAEDDGWLLQLGYDAKRDETYLDIVDAGSMERAAKIWTSTHLPLGFHGNFTTDSFVEPPS